MPDGMLEHLLALHAQMADGLGRRRPAVDVELVLVCAVRAQAARSGRRGRSPSPARFQHHARRRRRRTARRWCGPPVEDARKGFRADHQGAPRQAAANMNRRWPRHRRSRSRPPACRRRAVRMPSLLDVDGGSRKGIVGRRRGETIRSMSSGRQPGIPSAARAAARPAIEVVSPVGGDVALRMPVRCTIHSSEVSTVPPVPHWS
jgi:hypothetical protein